MEKVAVMVRTQSKNATRRERRRERAEVKRLRRELRDLNDLVRFWTETASRLQRQYDDMYDAKLKLIQVVPSEEVPRNAVWLVVRT